MLLNCGRKCCGQIGRWAAEKVRFVRAGRWFVTRLVHFWEPPALCSGVSLRRTAHGVPGGRELWGGLREHFRPLCRCKSTPWKMFLHSHTEYIVGFLRIQTVADREAWLPLLPNGPRASVWSPSPLSRREGNAGWRVPTHACPSAPLAHWGCAWILQPFPSPLLYLAQPCWKSAGWGFQAAGGPRGALSGLGTRLWELSLPQVHPPPPPIPPRAGPRPRFAGPSRVPGRLLRQVCAGARETLPRSLLAAPPAVPSLGELD